MSLLPSNFYYHITDFIRFSYNNTLLALVSLIISSFCLCKNPVHSKVLYIKGTWEESYYEFPHKINLVPLLKTKIILVQPRRSWLGGTTIVDIHLRPFYIFVRRLPYPVTCLHLSKTTPRLWTLFPIYTPINRSECRKSDFCHVSHDESSWFWGHLLDVRRLYLLVSFRRSTP